MTETKPDRPDREKIEAERRRIQSDIERAISVFGLKVNDGVMLWNIIQDAENIEARTPKLGSRTLREEVKSIISQASIYMEELTNNGESIEAALGHGADQILALIPDRPELREKIAKKLYEYALRDVREFIDEFNVVVSRNPRKWEDKPEGSVGKEYWYKRADQILALIPDIYCPHPEMGVTVDGCDECPMVEEAKREERDRIEKWFRDHGIGFWYSLTGGKPGSSVQPRRVWQALKEE